LQAPQSGQLLFSHVATTHAVGWWRRWSGGSRGGKDQEIICSKQKGCVLLCDN
jgi:hypothetical protein